MAECSALSEQPEPEGLAAFAWAKSLDDGLSWMPLWRHLDDTAAVADQLWSTRLSTSQRQLLATDFGSEDVARRIAIWLANVHDIGKASAAFALQVPQLRFAMESAGYGFHSIAEDERRAAPHGLVGKLAIECSRVRGGVIPAQSPPAHLTNRAPRAIGEPAGCGS